MFKDKVVLVGVSGGIAAYKSAELVSRLKKKGAQVYCLMTKAAREFLTPLTLQTLSQNPVYTDMFERPQLWNVEHVALADRADLMLIVPATANVIAKISAGVADDFLTTTVLACRCPILVAPAMNVHMYENPITQDNLARLKRYGYHIAEPGYGDLACGYQGRGRLADLEDIMAQAEYLLVQDKPLTGHRVLITAGPTREALDPVRYLSNKSTGKMGYALAKHAQLLGAEVTLISGPTNLPKPFGVKTIQVETAREMYEAVLDEYENARIVIKTAAVADFRPAEEKQYKIKKNDSDLELKMAKNPDILAELGKRKKGQLLIGFAAETNDVLNYARQKIISKNLDLIVANNVAEEGAGFAGETNIVTLVFPQGAVKELPLMSKEEAARYILQEAITLIKE